MPLILRKLQIVERICEMTFAITKERFKSMLTLILVFGLMPVLVFIELTIQKRLFTNATAKCDVEWELYQQRWD